MPGYLGLCQGQLGAGTPGHSGPWDTHRAGRKLRRESRCSGEEPEHAPPHHAPGRLRSSLPASHCHGQHSGARKALPLWVCFLFSLASEVFHVSNA